MRMLSKFILSGFVATFAVAVAPAHAEEGKQRFSHEGYTYVYDVKDSKAGQLVSGRRYPGAVAFNLAIRHGKVSGQSGGQSVAFKVDDAVGAISE